MLLREGLARLLATLASRSWVRQATRMRCCASSMHAARSSCYRHQDAADAFRRGARGRAGDRPPAPGHGVLVLSHYLESGYAMRLLEDLPERSGYLLKDRVSDVAVLTDALRRIGQGECVIDPTIVSRLLARHQSGPLADLTPREREILALMAEGHSNDGICRLLFLSPKTVEGHIHHIFLKLDLGDLPAYNRRVLAVLRFLRPG